MYTQVAARCRLPECRLLYEGRHWVILPTIGALVPGYVLLVSKRHCLSVMDCSGDEIAELERLLVRLRSVLGDVYRTPCIAFEHGSGCGTGMDSACIAHCHLHVLPLEEDIYDRIDFQNMQMETEPVPSLRALTAYGRNAAPYLLYQNQNEQFFVMHADTYLSQYFRQLAALSTGVPEKWNWRQYYFPENIRATLTDLKSEMEVWQ